MVKRILLFYPRILHSNKKRTVVICKDLILVWAGLHLGFCNDRRCHRAPIVADRRPLTIKTGMSIELSISILCTQHRRDFSLRRCYCRINQKHIFGFHSHALHTSLYLFNIASHTFIAQDNLFTTGRQHQNFNTEVMSVPLLC